MLSRAHRFHGYNSLRHVYKYGQTVRLPILAIRYYQNPKRNSYRVAVIVSKKTEKSAVVRNRIRRRVYEAVRTVNNITQPYDIVLTVFKAELKDMPDPELKRLIATALVKAKVIGK